MKPQEVSKVLNRQRVILYLSALVVCCVGAYILFYLIPRLKSRALREIEFFYQQGAFEAAIEACHAYIGKYPKEPQGYLWLGRCYDGVALQIREHKKLCETYQQNSKNPYYTRVQRQEFEESAKKAAEDWAKWGNNDYASEALAQYQKAFEISPEWRTGIEIAESHIHAGRMQQADDIVAKISPPDVLPVRTYHALIKMQIAAGLESEGRINLDIFAAQCRDTLELYGKMPVEEMLDDLKNNRAMPYLYLGEISKKNKDLEQSKKYYSEATAILEKIIASKRDSEDAAPYRSTASRAYLDWGIILQQDGDYIKAEYVLTKAVQIAPSSARAHYERARTNAMLWNIPAALVSLNIALYQEITDPKRPLYNRVLTDEAWGELRHQPAFQMLLGWPDMYQPPIEIQQNLRNAIYCVHEKSLKPEEWLKQDELNQAMSFCYEMLATDANCYPACLLLVYCKLVQKFAWETDIAQKKERLSAESLSAEEKTALEQAQKMLEYQNQEFNEYLGVARKISPSPLTEMYIAYCHFKISNLIGGRDPVFFPKTVELVHGLIEKFGDQPEFTENAKVQAFCYYMMGDSNLRLEQNEEAILHLSRATELDIANPFYRLCYAEALSKVQKIEEAVQQYQKALEKANVPYLHYAVGCEFLELQRLAEAREHFQTCVTLSPTWQGAWYHLAKAYLLEGDARQALIMLENAYKNEGNARDLNCWLNQDHIWEPVFKNPEYNQELMRIFLTYPAR